MSYYDYHRSVKLAEDDAPFYALIMAAVRRADTENLRKLTILFPDTVEEFTARYNAPGGILEGD